MKFAKFDAATIEVWEWISNFIPTILCMRLFIHVQIFSGDVLCASYPIIGLSVTCIPDEGQPFIHDHTCNPQSADIINHQHELFHQQTVSNTISRLENEVGQHGSEVGIMTTLCSI